MASSASSNQRLSAAVGTRFDQYFVKDRPYLDGYKAYFVKSESVVAGIQLASVNNYDNVYPVGPLALLTSRSTGVPRGELIDVLAHLYARLGLPGVRLHLTKAVPTAV